MRQAVCFLQPAFYGAPTLYLAVTRPGRPNDWGLPGGKVEDGETLEQAIIREVKEETGLTICNPIPVFHRISQTEQFEVTVFTGTVIAEDKPKEDLRVGYISKKKLIDGPFGGFNKEMFEQLDPEVEERPLLERYDVVGDHLKPDPHGKFVFATPALQIIEGLESNIDYLIEELGKQPIRDVAGYIPQDFEVMRLQGVIEKLENLLAEALPWVDDRHEDRLHQRIKVAIPPWARLVDNA